MLLTGVGRAWKGGVSEAWPPAGDAGGVRLGEDAYSFKMHISLILLPPGGGRGAVKPAPLRRRSCGERLGWEGQAGHVNPAPDAALSPPPSPSPVKGEGIEEGKSLPAIALVDGLQEVPEGPLGHVPALLPPSSSAKRKWMPW